MGGLYQSLRSHADPCRAGVRNEQLSLASFAGGNSFGLGAGGGRQRNLKWDLERVGAECCSPEKHLPVAVRFAKAHLPPLPRTGQGRLHGTRRGPCGADGMGWMAAGACVPHGSAD